MAIIRRFFRWLGLRSKPPIVDDEGRDWDRGAYYDDYDWTLDTFGRKRDTKPKK